MPEPERADQGDLMPGGPVGRRQEVAQIAHRRAIRP